MKTMSLLFCIAFTMTGYSQRITLKENNEPLPKVLHDIEKLTGYQFFFSDNAMKSAKKVSIDVTNDDLSDILNICFRNQPLIYQISGSTVTIKPKDEDLKKNENLHTPDNIANIRGHVTDSLGNPLVGASVLVKGSVNGTTTDAKGEFVLKNAGDNTTIIISYTGYATMHFKINGTDDISIALNKSINALDEIQVIAYGTVTKALNTGDVSTVKAKEIEQQPVANPLLALEGLVTGLQITQNTGMPGGGVTIQIRGQNSITNGNSPLYIVDGVPYASGTYLPSISTVLGVSTTSSGNQFTSGSPFNYINPSDIESVNILKDADATAIYGTRGANGVILITTKKGKSGVTRVDINMQSGWGKVADKMKLLNTPQYLEMRNEAFKNDNATPNPNADYDLTLWDTTRDTDWQKELLGGKAEFTDINVTVSGGNSNTQFLIGGSYNKQTTVFPGSFNDQKGSANFNINNTSPNKKFNIQLTGLYLIDNNFLPDVDLTTQAIQLAPVAPPMYNPDGSINWAENSTGVSTWPGGNPAALLLTSYKIETNNLISNAVVSYKIIPGLDVKVSAGYTNTQTNELVTVPLTAIAPSSRTTVQRRTQFGNNSFNSWIIEPQGNYTTKFVGGMFSALVGTTIQQNISNSQQIYATGFNSDQVMEDLAAATSFTASTVYAKYKYNALFGRINYNWNDKYLLNINVRRDGSSRFGPSNEFHNFWSIGAGWIFSATELVKNKFSFLSFGKLRGSIGTTGSDQVGDYTFLDQYVPNNFAVPYEGAISYYPNRIFTPDLSWEETKKMEAGIELGILNDRILLNVSFYNNRSSDQLLAYQLAAITGFTSVERNLSAVVQNRGWEAELKTVNIKSKDFNWSTSFNFSANQNELLSGAPGLDAFYAAKIGYPLNSVLVYHSLGVNTITGLYQFENNEGKPTASPNPATDATTLINPAIRFFGGLSNTFSYKGFQLSFLFQFTKRPEQYSYPYDGIVGSFNYSFGGNQPVEVLNRWQQAGDVKPIQRFSQNFSTSTSFNYAQNSDILYSDGSFIRLKNISISWQMPDHWIQRMHIRNAQFYIHAQNLLTLTNYKGLDPEIGYLALPPLKVITFGLQLGL